MIKEISSLCSSLPRALIVIGNQYTIFSIRLKLYWVNITSTSFNGYNYLIWYLSCIEVVTMHNYIFYIASRYSSVFKNHLWYLDQYMCVCLPWKVILIILTKTTPLNIFCCFDLLAMHQWIYLTLAREGIIRPTIRKINKDYLVK